MISHEEISINSVFYAWPCIILSFVHKSVFCSSCMTMHTLTSSQALFECKWAKIHNNLGMTMHNFVWNNID